MQAYLDEGWRVEILPWVVGILGLQALDSDTILSCPDFLEIPRHHWRRITGESAKDSESVKALCSSLNETSVYRAASSL